MKHLEVRQNNSAARRILHSLLSVSSDDETLRPMPDILSQTSMLGVRNGARGLFSPSLLFRILCENESKF